MKLSVVQRMKQKPGSWDALKTSQLFPASNPYGIPDLWPVYLAQQPPKYLLPYRTRVRSLEDVVDGAIHFFLDDFRFETVWNRPKKAMVYLQNYSTLLSPDFSLYADWPLALQLFNIYRSRWLARYWQEKRFTIIPTVSWSDAASFEFCFLGIPRGALVAVSAVGTGWQTDPAAEARFMYGFEVMVNVLDPRGVIAYGPLPAKCSQLTAVYQYPTRWTNIRAARRDSYELQGV